MKQLSSRAFTFTVWVAAMQLGTFCGSGSLEFIKFSAEGLESEAKVRLGLGAAICT